MAPAKECTDHIIAVHKKGGMKVEVYRHVAVESRGFSSLSIPSMQEILDMLPSVLFVVLCIAFIVQKSSICVNESGKLAKLTRGLCYVSWSIPLAPLAGLLFVMTILKQVKRTISRKTSRTSAKKLD